MKKRLTFKRIFLLTLLFLVGLYTGIYFLGGAKPVKASFNNIPFSEEGFIQAMDPTTKQWNLNNTNRLVATSDNNRFEFRFDERTTYFKLVDTVTGKEWKSNPYAFTPLYADPYAQIVPATRTLQRSLFLINYIGPKGATAAYNSHEHSVQVNTASNILPSFSVKYIEGGVQVLYEVYKKGIDYTYFPFKISESRMNELFKDHENLTAADWNNLTTNYYELVIDNVGTPDELRYYKVRGIASIEAISGIFRTRLYEIMYEKAGYTRDDVAKDNAEFGVEVALEQPHFRIGIQYLVTNTGLEITLINDAIIEDPKYPIAYIDLLPHFTSGDTSTSGYFVIPDGSGAIMDFNNDKQYYPSYTKRIYGPDKAYIDSIKPESQESILLPLYGLVDQTNQTGMMVVVEKGAGQTYIAADVSRRIDSFNRAFFKAYYRESQFVTIGSGWQRHEYTKWSTQRIESDFVYNYIVLDSDEANYVGIAKKYQEKLIAEHNLTPIVPNNQVNVNIEFIGAYGYRQFFLGIGFDAYDSMTTYKEAKQILEELRDLGVTDINVIYNGWQEKGFTQLSPRFVRLSNQLGNKKAFNDFKNYLMANDYDLYMYYHFSEYNEFHEAFGKTHYTTRNVGGDYAEFWPYNLATNEFDRRRDSAVVLSPKFYQHFMETFAKNYQKSTGLDSVSLAGIGSVLAGDYKKRAEFFRESAIVEHISALELAHAKGITNINLYAPLGFAIPYASSALEVPSETSKYEIFDNTIPFYQLVVSGLFEYSGYSVNGNIERGVDWHMLKTIETGANLSFILSFEDSKKLITTDYTQYYFTYYQNWLTTIQQMTQELNGIGIFGGTLVNHITHQNGVYEVHYSNGVEILLNYNNIPVMIGSHIVPATGYKVI